MVRESSLGTGSKVKPKDELTRAREDLLDVNNALENAANDPSMGKFSNMEGLQRRKQRLTKEIEKLSST